MSEIADDMLTGVTCGMCGQYLDCEDCQDIGIPAYCSNGCAEDAGADKHQVCRHHK